MSHPRRPLARLNGSGPQLQWWVPNAAGHRRMLFAAGFEILSATRPYCVPFGPGHPGRRTGLRDAAEPARASGWWPATPGVTHAAALDQAEGVSVREWKDTSVLVTGAQGFVGSWLAERLLHEGREGGGPAPRRGARVALHARRDRGPLRGGRGRHARTTRACCGSSTSTRSARSSTWPRRRSWAPPTARRCRPSRPTCAAPTCCWRPAAPPAWWASGSTRWWWPPRTRPTATTTSCPTARTSRCSRASRTTSRRRART